MAKPFHLVENQNAGPSPMVISTATPNLMYIGQYQIDGDVKYVKYKCGPIGTYRRQLSFFVILIGDNNEDGLDGYWRTAGTRDFMFSDVESALDNPDVDWVMCDPSRDFAEIK